MAAEPDEHTTRRETIGSGIRETVDVRFVGVLGAGSVAGYVVFTLLNTDTVALPLVGAVSGQLLGIVGLAAFAVAYQRFGCAGSCGSAGDCGCSDECGNQCSDDS
ncbi:hypothetical protein OB955_04405 [Halobacteria archaeon AArc-m2/3/4]|uniref:Uncharacterized protein n=1 Tax=Natronoglomus mannanivorans TaxID=2979990 RepID=A0AAP2Z0H3_9EURY|nr:hypothetical protein [Halobacteria archaeon AArc-xg1-1]MCU4971978.1 hypothetical protein [Halobacteria archaeon AArc-m2/3/4]